MTDKRNILTINSGSSSIKFSLYRIGRSEPIILAGEIEKIGFGNGFFRARDGSGKKLVERRLDIPDHSAALKTLFEWLKRNDYDRELDAVGHRVVHGGARYTEPQPVTRELITYLRKVSPFAPEHLPHELDAIEAVCRHYPAVKQVACFDTAFHRNMPKVAQQYALPGHLKDEGIIRYGFHGLSYEYILEELAREAGEGAASGRIIIAHLGHGASMAAVCDRQCIDTTMGFTPTGGLVMSTRSGDLDPGLLLYLLEQKGMKPHEVNEMVNRNAGLLGISGISGDMRELLSIEDENAKMAVHIFCYQAKKFIGSLAAVLGGVETLVFTGGIGENSTEVRRRICSGLEFFGIFLDEASNIAHASIISAKNSPVTVRVMKTNEELMITRHVCEVIG